MPRQLSVYAVPTMNLGMGLSSRRQVERAFFDRCWFDKMEGYIQWKVVPPDYNNPFKPPVADHILRELVRSRRALRRVCKLRCACDGYEIMSFDNLDTPSMFTEHPCISRMGITRVLDYVSSGKMSAIIEDQLERIELEMRLLLEERDMQPESEGVIWGEHITVRELRERRERSKQRYATAAGEYRIKYESPLNARF